MKARHAILSTTYRVYDFWLREQVEKHRLTPKNKRDAEIQLNCFCAVEGNQLRGLNVYAYTVIGPIPTTLYELEKLEEMEEIAKDLILRQSPETTGQTGVKSVYNDEPEEGPTPADDDF